MQWLTESGSSQIYYTCTHPTSHFALSPSLQMCQMNKASGQVASRASYSNVGLTGTLLQVRTCKSTRFNHSMPYIFSLPWAFSKTFSCADSYDKKCNNKKKLIIWNEWETLEMQSGLIWTKKELICASWIDSQAFIPLDLWCGLVTAEDLGVST